MFKTKKLVKNARIINLLFQLSVQRNNKNLNRTAGDYTRKYATRVGNWKLFQIVKKCSIQWRDWINSATTKENLDNSITNLEQTG